MKTTTCARIDLVEALRDGRLGAGDAESMARHLATCAECRAASVDLERISCAIREPIERASQLDHLRARTSLLQRASRVAAPPAARTPAFAVLAAAAVLAVAIAGAFAAGRSSAAPERAMVAVHRRVADRLAPRRTTLRPSDHARFDRANDGGVDVVTLTEGEIDVTRSPVAAGERFVVRTRDAEIEVRATAFRVEAAGGRIRGVAVAEGSVEVRYAGFTAVIPAGGSWRANDDAGADATKAAAAVDPSGAASAKPEAPPPIALAPTKEARARHEIVARAPGPAREPVAVAIPAPAAAPIDTPRGPSAEAREFADAVGAVGRGDYDGAAARLDAFTAAHPRDARADEADHLRAIALQRAGRLDEARAAARRYLAAHPDGAHRTAARAIAGD